MTIQPLIGIDVAKHELVVYRQDLETQETLENRKPILPQSQVSPCLSDKYPHMSRQSAMNPIVGFIADQREMGKAHVGRQDRETAVNPDKLIFVKTSAYGHRRCQGFYPVPRSAYSGKASPVQQILLDADTLLIRLEPIPTCRRYAVAVTMPVSWCRTCITSSVFGRRRC